MKLRRTLLVATLSLVAAVNVAVLSPAAFGCGGNTNEGGGNCRPTGTPDRDPAEPSLWERFRSVLHALGIAAA